jgi:hypothetical protein
MAVFALNSEKASVDFWLRMALHTFLGSAFVIIIGVAGNTFDLCMAAFEREEVTMIEVT